MRRVSRTSLISALCIGAALIFHQPVRHGALTVFRFPFTLLKTCVRLLITLPRLPSLDRENADLKTALIQQQLELAQLRELLRHTRQSQTFAEASVSAHGVVAVVLSRSTIPTQQTILLDKGSHDGLSVDSVILDAGGVVGRVIELHPQTCLVLLLTDVESRVAGVVDRSRETGLLVGRDQGWCEFTYLNVESDIQEGDQIMTAGLGGTFPKGLSLGTVVRVVKDESSGAAWARVKPAARLGQLEEVLCLPAGGK